MQSKIIKIISIIIVLMAVCAIGLFVWDKSYPEDQVATNDFLVHDSDLQLEVSKMRDGRITFWGKVMLFINDDCTCPEGAMCEPCARILKVTTTEGEEISILPGPNGNFKGFEFLQVGNTYEFTVDVKTFEAGLVHYILINAK